MKGNSTATMTFTGYYIYPWESWIPNIPYSQHYNYKCPDCGGEFNYPAQKLLSGCEVEFRCPFCGRVMKGME